LWAAAIVLINQRTMTARATNALIGFLELIKQLDKQAEGLELYERLSWLSKSADWLSSIKKKKWIKARKSRKPGRISQRSPSF